MGKSVCTHTHTHVHTCQCHDLDFMKFTIEEVNSHGQVVVNIFWKVFQLMNPVFILNVTSLNFNEI